MCVFVELLLRDPRVDPSAKNNEAIRDASSGGKWKVVELLLKDPKVDPAAMDNEAGLVNGKQLSYCLNILEQHGIMEAIRKASYRGHYKVVEKLLQDSRVDPSTRNNEAIRRSRQNGHKKVVQLLSRDPRFVG